MTPDLLHVVTCIYNPLRWQTRIRHFKHWAPSIVASGARLTVIECALGERSHELDAFCAVNGIEHLAVRASTLAWNKESLLNAALVRSQIRTPYIAWIDADVLFSKPSWASDTVHALQQYHVVQPWSSALDLGPDGEPMVVKGHHVQTSFCKVWHETGDIKGQANGKDPYVQGWRYPHPGYAWAARRSVIEAAGGLLDVSGLGAADHQMSLAFVGMGHKAIHGQTHPNYQAAVRAWGDRAYRIVQGNVGYVVGRIEHLFHGAKAKRRYHERWDILVRHAYDPLTDIHRNLDGVMELSGNKPAMRHEFDQYFRQRDEDANILLEDEVA